MILTGHVGSSGSLKLLLLAFLMEPSTLVLRLMVSSMPVVRPRFTLPVSVLYSSTPTIRLRLLPVFSVSRLRPGAEAMLYFLGLIVIS